MTGELEDQESMPELQTHYSECIKCRHLILKKAILILSYKTVHVKQKFTKPKQLEFFKGKSTS